MASSLALFAYVAGIGGLFFLDRDDSARTSKFLWLPVIWLWTNAARPLSFWLGMSLPDAPPGQPPASSLLDQLVAGSLVLFGINALVRRRRDVIHLLRISWPVVLYFSFGLVSLLWSDFPGWGLKRWLRAMGELVMAMVVVTEAHQTAAFGRLLSRVGFVLLPTSVLLIRYFPNLGRGFDPYGFAINRGVCTDKNMVGVVTFVLTLGALWQVLTMLRGRKQHNRARRLLAQCALLFFGIELLFTSHSATSGASFTLGAGLLVATTLPLIRHRPAAVQALVVAILLGGGLIVLLGGRAEAVAAMGRNDDFTGRTEIWEVLSGMAPEPMWDAPNPIVGAGFETFWLGQRVAYLYRLFPGLNEAHNGYLEVYVNLGLLGVGLIALILGQSYRRAICAFRRDPTLGGLLVAYILTAAIYSITEAGFRMLGPAWFFLLLSALAAGRLGGVGKGRVAVKPRTADPSFMVGDSAISSTSTRLE